MGEISHRYYPNVREHGVFYCLCAPEIPYTAQLQPMGRVCDHFLSISDPL